VIGLLLFENPHELMPQPLNDEKITVWVGLPSEFILEPYFFEEEDNHHQMKTVTINGQRYKEMLENFVLPAMRSRPDCDVANMIFQQDGAPPHIYRPVKNLLAATFENRIISRHFPVSWPPRSPDLNPLDFWLWGYLKSKVFTHSPQTLNEPKQAIPDEISAITKEELTKAVSHFSERINALIAKNGGHFEHTL